jgi:MoaA/NifB/PqqE/SkfB family radical SAM enzyme
MCGQVDAPIEAGNSQQNRSMLPTELTLQRLEELPNLKSAYLFGGEPLLHKDIFQILEYLKKRKVLASFSTNGLLLAKFAQKIVETAPHMISVSLDSHIPEVHDEIRGLKGSYDRALAAASQFLQYRAAAGAEFPRIKFHFTITPDNYHTMLDFYDTMADRFPNVDEFRFHFPRFATAEMGAEYERVMLTEFDSMALSWRGNFSNDEMAAQYRAVDTQELSSMITELMRRPRASVTGPTDPGEIAEFFREPDKMPEGRRCACFNSLAIQPNGDCVMCADYPDFIMGNIADTPLLDIWNGERALKWRNYLRDNGNPGVLVKCSRLYPNLPSNPAGTTTAPSFEADLDSEIRAISEVKVPTMAEVVGIKEPVGI